MLDLMRILVLLLNVAPLVGCFFILFLPILFILSIKGRILTFTSNFVWIRRYASRVSAPYIFRRHQSLELLFRVATCYFRTLPDVHIVGEMKCGTTALEGYMVQHPNISKPWIKETHFLSDRSVFRSDFDDVPCLYRTFFSSLLSRALEMFLYGRHCLQFDATPQRLFIPSAARKVKQLTPNAKIIIMVRDPIERAISNYRMLSARNKETSGSFETAMSLEHVRVKPSVIRNETWRSEKYDWIFPELDYAYASRGHYVNGVERYVKIFGKQNVLILTMESLKNNPLSTMERVWTFLDIPSISIELVCANASKGKKPVVNRNVYDRLANEYSRSNLSLCHDYGLVETLNWCNKHKEIVLRKKSPKTKKRRRNVKITGHQVVMYDE